MIENENPSLCYQCAKCSAGCPVAEDMDVLPHQVIHLASMGMQDRVLKSKTIWTCAGCFTCAVRCPNDIDITSVMDGLRTQAAKEGIECPLPHVATFHKTFLNDLSRRNRIHEVRMMGEYNMRTMRPFHNAMVGAKMFFKRRLHLMPPKSRKGFKTWLKKTWKK